MWFNTLVTLLLYQSTLSLRILQDFPARKEHEVEGSGCQQSTENEHYFDYINVDDEDYYEDGSAVGFIQDHEEFVDEGPPVFTDTVKKVDKEAASVKMPESTREMIKTQIESETETSRFLSENLVLNNETHGSINGKILISNSGQGTILDLYFDDQENSTSEHKTSSGDIDSFKKAVVLSSDVSLSPRYSYSVLVVFLYLHSI